MGMNFKQAFEAMKAGAKVKLPSWGGYWCWNSEKETIEMHCRPKDADQGQGPVLDIRETQRVDYTISNILSDEWLIADETNCPVLGGEATFNFGKAIEYLKRGLKVARKGWNGKDQYLIYIEPWDNKYYEVHEKEIPGTLYPYVAIKTNYNGIVPWLASQTDMLAEDWVFAE